MLQEDSECNNPSCADPSCADPGCSNEGSPGAALDNPLAAANLGIDSFVYRAPRPFSEMRLLTDVVDLWPIPIKDTLEVRDYVGGSEPGAKPVVGGLSPFEAVIRSKGWISLDRYDKKGIFWSHAGRHFSLEIAPYYKTAETYPMAGLAASGGAEETGGFHELVFIGIDMDEKAITEALDDCLLNDREMEKYEESKLNEQPLRFDVGARVLAYTGDGPVDDGWSPGTVVALRYEEEGLEMPAPYQVALDEPEGVIIYAPLDDDRVVRAHVEE